MKELMIISIHATHTGGDAHICAVNLALPAISIHATHTGGDSGMPFGA